ncbi:MAG: matrixin family metalloprotease [Bdellovibrionaceae bacterium]|nr:matrixin family metalloprotease [Pseudobdellovibrionaceae bacterium]
MNVKCYKKTLLTSALIALSLVIQACGRNVSPEPACNFVQNAKLQRVSWNGRMAKMYIHSSVPSEYHATIKEAADVWNQKIGNMVISIESTVGGSRTPSQDGYNIIYWMTDWEKEKKSEQARTTIYWSGSKIYEADIRINAEYHNFFITDHAIGGRVDFKSLLVHEFGHVLGLAHVSQGNPSVMQAYLANGVTRRSLTDLDKSSLLCEYGH